MGVSAGGGEVGVGVASSEEAVSPEYDWGSFPGPAVGPQASDVKASSAMATSAATNNRWTI